VGKGRTGKREGDGGVSKDHEAVFRQTEEAIIEGARNVARELRQKEEAIIEGTRNVARELRQKEEAIIEGTRNVARELRQKEEAIIEHYRKLDGLFVAICRDHGYERHATIKTAQRASLTKNYVEEICEPEWDVFV
jgi:predicted ribosome quality control (RQC) complex YloA/Tae2 family protein